MISIIHPTRSRPEKSYNNIRLWLHRYSGHKENLELIVSLDDDDPYLSKYTEQYVFGDYIVNKNRSCVDAINRGAEKARGEIIIVVSDDTDCVPGWNRQLIDTVTGKSDYLLKTDDGIQDYIVTMTVMDRKYYERDGYIYHPDFKHQFADTYLTCKADIRGRLLFSKLKFPHLHYSHSGGKEMPDALHKRNDDTWMSGQDTFVKLMREFTPEERSRIKNQSMQNFMRHVRI